MPRTEVGSSEALLDELSEWVKLETPTTDPAAVNRLMDVAEAGLAGAGAAIERIPGRDGFGDNLIARMRQKHHAPDARPVLVAGHLDTVWAEGTLARMPFKVNGEKAHGPGIHDMKAGSFIAFHALCEIMRQGVRTPRPVTLLLTPDEEVGSPTSRDVIEREAAGAACVLIPEPAGQGGAAVTSRKGVGRFRMTVRGIGAHAGGAFEHGASAVVELAHQIQCIHAMVDPDAGITLNIAPIWGGTRPNVIAAEAGCEIDLRVPSVEDGERMTARLLALEPATANCKVTVTGEINRPPFAETPGITALYEHARAVAEGLGLPMPRQHRGGGSDGNFTAAMGIPTLDGLGCLGSGAHARHEHILWRHLAPRAALMAGLLETLD